MGGGILARRRRFMTQKKKVFDVNWNQLNPNTISNASNLKKEVVVDRTASTSQATQGYGSYGDTFPNGHVAYENVVMSKCEVSGAVKFYQNVRQLAISSVATGLPLVDGVTYYSKLRTINSEPGQKASTYLLIPAGAYADIIVESMMLIDLTAIYGEGREPTDPKVFEADFERWFGYPLSYEPYDEGSVRQTLPIYRFP